MICRQQTTRDHTPTATLEIERFHICYAMDECVIYIYQTNDTTRESATACTQLKIKLAF